MVARVLLCQSELLETDEQIVRHGYFLVFVEFVARLYFFVVFSQFWWQKMTIEMALPHILLTFKHRHHLIVVHLAQPQRHLAYEPFLQQRQSVCFLFLTLENEVLEYLSDVVGLRLIPYRTTIKIFPMRTILGSVVFRIDCRIHIALISADTRTFQSVVEGPEQSVVQFLPFSVSVKL